MDPITALAIMGSAASIISLFRRTGKPVTIQTISEQVIIQAREQPAGTRLKETIKSQILTSPRPHIEETVSLAVKLHSHDAAFLNRIKERCLNSFEQAVEDASVDDDELHEIYEVARFCVCRNLALVRKQNGGRLPSAEFRDLWKRFNCATV